MESIELISHHLCPYVQRAAISLAEKCVPFSRTYVDLAAKPEWFKQISPLGKVPLLRVQSDVIFESAVILEYLEDTLAPPLHPASPMERAKHRGWIEFGSAVLSDIGGFYSAPDATTMRLKLAALREKFQRVEDELERQQQSSDGPWFGGDAFCLVDAVFGPVFRYWNVFDEVDDFGVFTQLHRVDAWRHALMQRTSVRNAVTADYDERLRRFLRERRSHLSSLMSTATA